jgi:hypothetical protein
MATLFDAAMGVIADLLLRRPSPPLDSCEPCRDTSPHR